jgi:hypothetical protein
LTTEYKRKKQNCGTTASKTNNEMETSKHKKNTKTINEALKHTSDTHGTITNNIIKISSTKHEAKHQHIINASQNIIKNHRSIT